jgi:hypothetical protein
MKLTDKGKEKIKKMLETQELREIAIKLVDYVLNRKVGLSSSDLSDTAIFANGLDEIEDALIDNDFDGAFEIANDTAIEMLEDEGYSEEDSDLYEDKKSDFVGKEISHLMKDKKYPQKRAVAAALNIAKKKGLK